NPATDYDSIYIEQRTAITTFKRIAALKGTAITFSEYQLKGNMDYYYRVVAHHINGEDLYSYPVKIFLPYYVVRDRKSYTGQAIAIPGKVEAEGFDIGGEGFTYHDSDIKNVTLALRPEEAIDINDMGNGVYYVIDNYPGEWLEYTVNVAEKGLYDINAAIAAPIAGGTFRVKIGAVESEIIKAPTSLSWTKTKPVNFSMNLEAGEQIMRITFIEKPLYYLDYLNFTKNITSVNAPLPLTDRLEVYQSKQELIVNSQINQAADELRIYNILGSLVKTIREPGTSIRISIQDLHSGVYIVQLISQNQKLSKKIILQ
ncbi:MAG TPA: T9SS type A sorting domain-containing protein, partial [Prolixibacteraceae bacterium]